MDAKYLAEIKAREQAATPGPWETDNFGTLSAKTLSIVGEATLKKDATFISHARTDVPALVEQHGQDQQQIATLRAKLSEEVSRRYQAECNYDHTVKDRDDLKAQLNMYGGDEGITATMQELNTLKKALETAIHRALPNSSPDTVNAIAANLIEETQDQLMHESTHETHGNETLGEAEK